MKHQLHIFVLKCMITLNLFGDTLMHRFIRWITIYKFNPWKHNRKIFLNIFQNGEIFSNIFQNGECLRSSVFCTLARELLVPQSKSPFSQIIGIIFIFYWSQWVGWGQRLLHFTWQLMLCHKAVRCVLIQLCIMYEIL